MLVFDLDDTLYLERDFAFSGYRHLDRFVERAMGATGFGEQCRALFEAGERRHIFDVACKELGLTLTAEQILELVNEYRNHPPDIALSADAARYLTNSDRPFGLITDGPEKMQRNKISALNLDRFIRHIRPTGAWPDGFGKPHPRAFKDMESAASTGSKMVYVADNPAKDFVTPNKRGWLTVQILRAGAVHDPSAPNAAYAAHAQITSFDDLDAVLNELSDDTL
ncbi:MAG: HAD family hydrolase [Rhodobacteraceae bacterium]|nr:HAD family hydrolase [Paracoccaceae bacterium]